MLICSYGSVREAYEQNVKILDKMLEAFWKLTKQYAREARGISACRGEALMIYFASDDVTLRPEV